MRYSLGLLSGAGLIAALIAVPVHAQGQQPAVQTEQHDHEHQGAGDAKAGGATAQSPGMMNPDMMKMMADMKARDAKLEALVVKMNAAKGAEKTDAMAELLTALVQERQAMRSSMMGMMNMMSPVGGQGDAAHDMPKK